MSLAISIISSITCEHSIKKGRNVSTHVDDEPLRVTNGTFQSLHSLAVQSSASTNHPWSWFLSAQAIKGLLDPAYKLSKKVHLDEAFSVIEEIGDDH
jgi:hypothetical protein